MKAVLADTGPLYALADPDDRHHLRAHDEARRLEEEGSNVLLAYPTLLEAHALVLRRLGLAAARPWMRATLRGCGLLNPTAEHYLEATDRASKFRDQPITLFDAVLACLSRNLGIPVWTYDHHFDVMRTRVWR